MLILVSGVVQAAPEPPVSLGTTPVVTRLVKLLTEQERALQAAISSNDRTKIESFLMENFEERTAAMPATPITKAEWIDANLKRHESADSGSVEQATAHDFGEVVAFSFKSAAVGSKLKNGAYTYIVDMWRSEGNGIWKLAVRFRAEVDAPAQAPLAFPKK